MQEEPMCGGEKGHGGKVTGEPNVNASESVEDEGVDIMDRKQRTTWFVEEKEEERVGCVERRKWLAIEKIERQYAKVEN